MALCKQTASTLTIVVALFSIVPIYAEVSTQEQNGQDGGVTSNPSSIAKTTVSEQSNSSKSPAVTGPLSNVSDSNNQENASAKPDAQRTTFVTESLDSHQDTTDNTTIEKSGNSTQNPVTDKNITRETAKASTSVSPNTTQSQPHSAKPTNSEQSNTGSQHERDETSTQSGTDLDGTTEFTPVSFDTLWMNRFFSTHHFEGRYMFNGVIYLFDFVVRYKHPDDPKTLVSNFYDADGAILEFNGTSTDGRVIVFLLSRIYTPGLRFALKEPVELVGSFPRSDQPYFTGNFTKPINSSFSWFKMNKGLGAIETGETAGTRTAIVIIIPTSIAFLGICGAIAIVCWASKKGYLRGRHKSYRLFTNAQVSYESEAETIHI